MKQPSKKRKQHSGGPPTHVPAAELSPEEESDVDSDDEDFVNDNLQFASFLSSADLETTTTSRKSAKAAKKEKREQKEEQRGQQKENWKVQADKEANQNEAQRVAQMLSSKHSTAADQKQQQVANTLVAIDGATRADRKRKGKKQDEELEKLNKPESYEETTRRSWRKGEQKTERSLLPTKALDGRLIAQKPVTEAVVEKDEEESDDEEDEEDEEEDDEEFDKTTGKRKRKGEMMMALDGTVGQSRIERSKRLLAEGADKILANPESQLGLLRQMLELCTDKDTTVKQYGMAATTAVVVDVLPDYKLKDKSKSADPQSGLSNQVAERDRYEQGLLVTYARFLINLKAASKGRSPVALRAIGCQCSLLETALNFNLWQRLIKSLVPRMCSRHSELRTPVCASVRKVFKADKAGERSLEIVTELARIAKAQPSAIQTEMLQTFLALPLNTKMDDADLEQYEAKIEDRKKKRIKKNKRAQIAAERQLQYDMKATAAEADAAKKRRTQTATLRLVFTVYFRILKNSPEAELLPAVLQGIAKFAHLINVDFINDLMVCLEVCMTDASISLAGRLAGCLAVLRFVHSQGSIFNTDLKDVHTHLFNLIKELASMPSAQHIAPEDDDEDEDEDQVATGVSDDKAEAVANAVECLQLLLFNRAQLTQSRAAGFVKMLMAAACQTPDSGFSMTLTAVSAGLIDRFSRTTQMLETDSSALGEYRSDVNDPEYCNALASKAWEFNVLASHYHPGVAGKAGARLTNTKDPLALQTPLELFKQYQNLQTFDLTPSMEEPGKRGQHKKRPLALPLLPEYISDYLAEGAPAVAAADDVEAPDFGSLFRTANKWKKNRKLHRELRGLSARMNAYHRQKK